MGMLKDYAWSRNLRTTCIWNRDAFVCIVRLRLHLQIEDVMRTRGLELFLIREV